jgi:hypothetical protein
MTISYIFQLQDFLIMVLIGISIGFILNFLKIIVIIKNKSYLRFIYEFISTIAISITCIIAINQVNMGEIRLFLLSGYLIGIVIQKTTLGKLFAKLVNFMYNRCISASNRFKTSKLGEIIFK